MMEKFFIMFGNIAMQKAPSKNPIGLNLQKYLIKNKMIPNQKIFINKGSISSSPGRVNGIAIMMRNKYFMIFLCFTTRRL